MKTAIITGASGNLGQAVIKKFLAEGFTVVGTVIPNDPVAINIQEPAFEPVIVDLMSEESSQQFVANIVGKHQQIDVAVLTVGGFAMGKIAETKSADVLKQYKLNFETAYNVARPIFTQMMKQGRGHIFLVGSRSAIDMRNS